ncbi:MAG: redoxin domain-containing protein [Planctomycetes bacterium]|nr:redoxin domain-containing protein [Planctomycetota bacterium]
MGHLNELHKALSAKGVLIVGVAIGEEKDKKQIKKFSKKKIEYTVVWDQDNAKVEQYDPFPFPLAYVLDRENKILWKGAPASLTVEKLEEFLREP